MKPTELRQPSAAGAIESSDWDDDGDFKDVYYPDFDELPGETSTIFALRYSFACGGYRVIRAEGASTHPVLIIYAIGHKRRGRTATEMAARRFHGGGVG